MWNIVFNLEHGKCGLKATRLFPAEIMVFFTNPFFSDWQKNRRQNAGQTEKKNAVAWPLGGQECHPWQQKICQKLGKRGRNQEKSGKKRKNWEERAKIGKALSLCLSWQIGLAMLLEKCSNRSYKSQAITLCHGLDQECCQHETFGSWTAVTWNLSTTLACVRQQRI